MSIETDENKILDTNGDNGPTKNLLLISLANGLSLSFIALFWLIGVYIVEKSLIGEISFILSLSTLFSGTAQLGLGMAKMTLYPRSCDESVREDFDAIALAGAILAMIILSAATGKPQVYGIIVFSQVAFGMAAYDMLALRQYKHFSLWMIATRLMQLCTGIALLILNLDANLIALGYTVPLLVFAPRFLRNSWVGLGKFSFGHIKENFGLTMHLSAISILRTYVGYLDKVIVGLFLGFVLLGEYQFVYQVYTMLQFFPLSVFSNFVPEMSSGKNRMATWKPFLGGVLLCLLAFLGAKPAVDLLLPAYSETVTTIYFVILSVLPATLSSVFASDLITNKKTGFLLAAYVVSFAGQYCTIIFLTTILGLIGVGISLLIGQLFLLASTTISLYFKK